MDALSPRKVGETSKDLSAEKAAVQRLHHEILAPDADLEAVLSRRLAPDHLWRGFHPFNEQIGPQALARSFWSPLKDSLTCLQMRPDIFFAGANEIDGFQGIWVVTMGHLMGLFDRPFLGIAPTGKMAFLRFCEFARVADGVVQETAMFFDLPHLMNQAGCNPFGPQTAAELVQPGPQTHDGLLYGPQPAQLGRETLDLVNRMITDLGTWQGALPLEEELRRTWAEDMIWWGPTGIGATYTIPRYALQHAGPFRAGFTERTGTGHIARLAEGHYAGFFGWPNFRARPTGGFMGMPGSDIAGEFRVIDIYRRAGDRLAENWIFIDLLHFWKGQGHDFLAEG